MAMGIQEMTSNVLPALGIKFSGVKSFFDKQIPTWTPAIGSPYAYGQFEKQRGKTDREERIQALKTEMDTSLQKLNVVKADTKKLERARRTADVTARSGPSQWRKDIKNHMKTVKTEIAEKNEQIIVDQEKLGDLEKLVEQRYRKQMRKAFAEFAWDNSVLPEPNLGLTARNGSFAKLIDILKDKQMERLEEISGELNAAKTAFKEGLQGVDSEAQPEIAEFFKDLQDQSREMEQKVEQQLKGGKAGLQAVLRMVGNFAEYAKGVGQPMIDDMDALVRDLTSEINQVKDPSEEMIARLQKLLISEKGKLDALSEQYELKVEEEQKLRFGDGDEEKGRIKEINDKWTKDQRELIQILKGKADSLVKQYTTMLVDTNQPAIDVEAAAREALRLKSLLVDNSAVEGGDITKELNSVREKQSKLTTLDSWRSYIENMRHDMDAAVVGSGGVLNVSKQNAFAFMTARLNNISDRYTILMNPVLASEDKFKDTIHPNLLLLEKDLEATNSRLGELREWDRDNKTELGNKLSEARILLQGYKSASNAPLYQKVGTRYLADLNAPSQYLNTGPDLRPFAEVADGDGKRRLAYVNDAKGIFEEAKIMQKRTIEKKIREANAFLESQMEIASTLHSSIQQDLSSAEQTARVEKQSLSRTRVGAAEVALSGRKLQEKIDAEIAESQNSTGDAAGKLRQVAAEVNAGTVKNVQHEFAEAAQSVDQEFARLAPRRAYALNAVEDRLEDAADSSMQPTYGRQQELLSMGVKAGHAKSAVEKQAEAAATDIGQLAKEIARVRKQQEQAKPKMLKRIRKAFGAMQTGLEEKIRDGIHSTVIRGQRTIDKAKSLAQQLETVGGFTAGKMQLGRADVAEQLAKDATRKSRVARDRAEVVEEAAAGSTTDAIDRVAELANSATGMGKADLKELESLLSNAQQNLEVQAMRSDAASQKFRYDATLKGERAQRSITAEGWTADTDLRSTEQSIASMANQAAGIVGLEAGLLLPNDGGLEDAGDMMEGIVGMESDAFKRLAANQHQQLSIEQRELGAIVGAVTDLTQSFSEDFDEETAALPHAATDAANVFGEASADAAAATDAELAEAEAIGSLRMPSVGATMHAADQLAEDVAHAEGRVETEMQKLMKGALKSAKEEHAAEVDNLGTLVEKLSGAFEPLPQLTDFMEQVHSVDVDATLHLGTLQQQEASAKMRVASVLDGVVPLEESASQLGREMDATKPHRPVVPGMPTPNGAKGAEDLRVRMSGEAAAASHAVAEDLQRTSQEFSETSGGLLQKQGGLRDGIAKDVVDGAADESAVTAELRSKSTGDLARAQSAESTAGEVYVNLEQQVDTLEGRINRLYDSAVAFGKVHAVDFKPRKELLAAARALENLEGHKRAVQNGTRAGCASLETLSEITATCVEKPWEDFTTCEEEVAKCTGPNATGWLVHHCCLTCGTECSSGDMKGSISMLAQEASQVLGILGVAAAEDGPRDAREQAMDRDLHLLIARGAVPSAVSPRFREAKTRHL